MKKSLLITLSTLVLFCNIFTSCDAIKNTNNTQRGAAIGTVAGSILGGVLGNNIGKGGNGALGAVLGGIIGGAAGGVIGNKMDKQAREISTALPGADVVRAGEGIKLVLKEDAIRFATNKATLTASAKKNLDKLVAVFNAYPDTNIVIYGYTDNTGSAEYNFKLSEERAKAVRIYLTTKGLQDSRFSINGLGIADPIATNETEIGRSQNRRVEFAITANENMIEKAKQESNN